MSTFSMERSIDQCATLSCYIRPSANLTVAKSVPSCSFLDLCVCTGSQNIWNWSKRNTDTGTKSALKKPSRRKSSHRAEAANGGNSVLSWSGVRPRWLRKSTRFHDSMIYLCDPFRLYLSFLLLVGYEQKMRFMCMYV